MKSHWTDRLQKRYEMSEKRIVTHSLQCLPQAVIIDAMFMLNTKLLWRTKTIANMSSSTLKLEYIWYLMVPVETQNKVDDTTIRHLIIMNIGILMIFHHFGKSFWSVLPIKEP